MVFLLGAVVIAVAFAIVWFLPEEKLRTQSGIEAREAQEIAAACGARRHGRRRGRREDDATPARAGTASRSEVEARRPGPATAIE